MLAPHFFSLNRIIIFTPDSFLSFFGMCDHLADMNFKYKDNFDSLTFICVLSSILLRPLEFLNSLISNLLGKFVVERR